MKKLVLPTLVSVFILFFLASCSEKIEPGTTPTDKGPSIPVTFVDAVSAEQPVFYEAVGTVKARLSATVSSKLMGVIQAYNVKEGDLVRRGDPLVVLDERQVAAQLNQARAALSEAQKSQSAAVSTREAAEADARRAQLSYQRYQAMLAGEAITQETFETVEAQNKQAQAALARATAIVEAAHYRVSQARSAVDGAVVASKDALVLAPFDGEVTAKLGDEGSLATPGTPLLTLERKGGYRVDLVVPEAYIQSIHTGQSVDVRIPAVGEATITGSVDVIIPLADQGSRTFVVQIGVSETDAPLRSGMFARVPLIIDRRQMMRIPAAAVVHQGQLTGVYIVDTENTARFRLIRTGRAYGKQVEVISGLRDGTRLVASPPLLLTNGSLLEPQK